MKSSKRKQMSGVSLIEAIIALAMASMLLVVLTQLLTTTVRQESRLLARHKMNQAARDIFGQIDSAVRWADEVQVVSAHEFEAIYYAEDGTTVTDRYHFTYYPASGELVATHNGTSLGGLPDRMYIEDFEVANLANPDDATTEYHPLVHVSMNIRSEVDDTVQASHETLVANLETEFEIEPPTPTPTPTPVATNTPTPGPPPTNTPTPELFPPTSTPTPLPTATPISQPPAATNTPIPNPTATPRATNTPVPADGQAIAGGLIATATPRPRPTNTPTPPPWWIPAPTSGNTSQTTQPRPQPTNTPRPQPTNTPRPQPTNTPEPQAIAGGLQTNPPASTTSSGGGGGGFRPGDFGTGIVWWGSLTGGLFRPGL